MDKKKIYENWLEKKTQMEPSESFSDKVMIQIFKNTQRPKWLDIERLLEIISTNAFIKNGLIATSAVVGFIRVIYVITMFLSKGALNG